MSSGLHHGETDSMFSYNDRTQELDIPMGDKSNFMQMIPEKTKMIDKYIQRCSALRFVFDYKKQKHGFNFHKAFKVLTELSL